MPVSQKDKNFKMLEEENAQLAQTVAELKNQLSASRASPVVVSPDSNNATRKLQDEINTLTKRNCGTYHSNSRVVFIESFAGYLLFIALKKKNLKFHRFFVKL